MLTEMQLLVIHIVSGFILDTAFSLACAAMAFLLWRHLAPAYCNKLYALFGISGLIIACMQPVQMFALAISMTGAAGLPSLWPQLPDVLHTHAGSILAPQAGWALCMAVCGLVPMPHRARSVCSSMSLLGLSLYRSASGHAAIDGSFSLRELSQWFHLMSTAIWAGGVMMAGLYLLPVSGDLHEQFRLGKHLSRQSAIAVILIAASGAWNTALAVEGDFALPLHTPWGAVLGIKLALVFLALLLGARNWKTLRQPASTENMAKLQSTIRWEAGLMPLILVFSAWLGSVSPMP